MLLTVFIGNCDMMRNLDLTSLRSFVTIADTGGVTRAAGVLNLTQSAVSMQIKRLEDVLGADVLDRTGRTVALTPAGAQLLSYARRMLDLNDEVYGLLTLPQFEGEVVLGVPHDIVYPAIPQVMQRFARDYPKVKMRLLSSFTCTQRDQFARGECDVIVTTEDDVGQGGTTLTELQLVWVGAPGGRPGSSARCRWPMSNAAYFDKGFRPGWTGRGSRGFWPWTATTRARSKPASAPIWQFTQCWTGPNPDTSCAFNIVALCQNLRG